MKNLATISFLLFATATEAALFKIFSLENHANETHEKPFHTPDPDNKENHPHKTILGSVADTVAKLGHNVAELANKKLHPEKDFSGSIKTHIGLPKPISLVFLGLKSSDHSLCKEIHNLDSMFKKNSEHSIEQIVKIVFCPDVLDYIKSCKSDEFIEKYASFPSQYELLTALMLRKATLEGIYSSEHRAQTFNHCMQNIRENLKNHQNWPSNEIFSAESVKKNFINFVKQDQYCKPTFDDKLEMYAQELKDLIDTHQIQTSKELHQALEGNLKTSEELIKAQDQTEKLAANKIGELLKSIKDDEYSGKNKFFYKMAENQCEKIMKKTDTLSAKTKNALESLAGWWGKK